MCSRLIPRVRRVSSRIFCLQRNRAFGAMRRFGSLLLLKLNPQELPLEWSGHRTLRLVHFELQSTCKKTSDIRHHSLPRLSAADVNVAVVRIPHEAVLTSLELAIEVVEYDVR